MAQRSDFGDVSLDIRGGGERSSDSGTPFRILILGDFSGHHNRAPVKAGEQGALAGRQPKLVDRDNFDEVLAKSGAELALPGVLQTPLRFSELDDFHPDRLFERASLFQKLRDLRARLSNPSTYAEAACDLGVVSKKASHVAEPAARQETPDVSRMAFGNLLDDAIGATEIRSGGEAPARKTDDLAAFIRRAVEPHLASKADPQQAELLGVIDQAAAAQMRALLHLSEFQALEAAWRALFFLVRRVETDASIKIFLLDVSKEELAVDLSSAEDISQAWAYKVLVEQSVQTPGGEPWALLMGNYTFGRDDLVLLTRLAHLAQAAGAPFIMGASVDLLGCEAISDLNEPRKWQDWSRANESAAWNALRGDIAASYLGLVLPRFLLRLPYGKETEAVASFNFEEMPGNPEHESYLWGNSAFLCACLLAESFARNQWSMRPEDELDISGLPLHIYQEDSESVAKPCAETLLPEKAALRILEAGLMPVASLKSTDSVRLVRFQSLASPLKALSGRWD